MRDDTHNVRLHVESTKYEDCPELNALKAKLIEALRRPEVEQAVRARGYDYARLTREDDVQGEWCTEAFRVVLRPDQNTHSPRENVLAVHNALGDIVEQVVEQFADQIAVYFTAEHV